MLKRITYCVIFSFLLFACQAKLNKESNIKTSKKDSIVSYLKLAKKKDSLCLNYLEKAQQICESNKLDSLWFITTTRLLNHQYRLKQYRKFKTESETLLKRATEVNDSTYIASGHYNLGSFYFKTFAYDSAYYNFNEAQDVYKKNRR